MACKQRRNTHSMTISTPPITRTSPASKLSDDVLLYIFQMNANMDEDPEFQNFLDDTPADIQTFKDHAFFVTCRSSAVCRQWRKVILESTYLWGGLVDLNCLAQRKGHWRTAVLERTGNAHLYVKGVIKHEDPFIPILDATLLKHWSRIRRVDVAICDADLFHEISGFFSNRPAPALQSLKFILRSYDYRTGVEEIRTPMLIHPETQALRHFDSNSLFLNPQATVLSTLRSLRISYRHQREFPFTLDSFAHALSQMTSLESLNICDTFQPPDDPPSPSLPHINLPHLREMSIFHEHECFALLNAITPHPESSVNLRVSENINDKIVVLKKVILRYVGQYANIHTIAMVHVHADHSSIKVRLFSSSDVCSEPPATFSFEVHFMSDTYSPDFLLSTFAECDLSLVTTLELDLARSMKHPTTPPNEVQNFISRLSGVENLVTNMRTLDFLDELPQDRRCTFPCLETLGITSLLISYGCMVVDDHGKPTRLKIDANLFIDFLSMRTGRVRVVDLTQCQLDDGVRFLERFSGLKVIWCGKGSREEHICGSGDDPTRLDFGFSYEEPALSKPRQRQRRMYPWAYLGHSDSP